MTRKGVWNLQQVRDKYLQSLWEYKINLFTWGGNSNGELGLNDKTNRSSPTEVPGGNWQISGAGNNETRNSATHKSTYGIKDDGTLWAWGDNGSGQLGQNNRTHRSSPIQIGSDTTWSSLSGGEKWQSAIKTDGTLWSWGYNYLGCLGQNTAHPTQYSSPVQIPGTNWSDQYCTVQDAIAAIKTDGTLWMWGRNHYGQLGQNAPANSSKSSPVQVGSGTDWAILARGSSYVNSNPIAIKTDGTFWTWGANEYGQLGQNSTLPTNAGISSPVQVPGTWSTTIRPAAAGYGRVIWGVKSDNTLWAWGQNNNGSFGIPSYANQDEVSSPVQVPGSWYEFGVGGAYNAFGVQPNLTPSQL